MGLPLGIIELCISPEARDPDSASEGGIRGGVAGRTGIRRGVSFQQSSSSLSSQHVSQRSWSSTTRRQAAQAGAPHPSQNTLRPEVADPHAPQKRAFLEPRLLPLEAWDGVRVPALTGGGSCGSCSFVVSSFASSAGPFCGGVGCTSKVALDVAPREGEGLRFRGRG